ncbi:MAG: hypothetical protein Q8R92_16840 [Deltaproteobacteria bacterium]|nr:hypothetical protein [Deltaproteobacteria bacterium]
MSDDRELLRRVLLSADPDWETRKLGHDWPELIRDIRTALTHEPAPPQPSTANQSSAPSPEGVGQGEIAEGGGPTSRTDAEEFWSYEASNIKCVRAEFARNLALKLRNAEKDAERYRANRERSYENLCAHARSMGPQMQTPDRDAFIRYYDDIADRALVRKEIER